MTTTHTTEDVATLAAIVQPFLRGEITPESVSAAAASARDSWDAFFQAQMARPSRHAALVGVLAGTYDEFRGEAQTR